MSWRIMLMDGTCGMAMGHGALDDRLQLESRAASTGDLHSTAAKEKAEASQSGGEVEERRRRLSSSSCI